MSSAYTWTATLAPGENLGANTDLRMKTGTERSGLDEGPSHCPPVPFLTWCFTAEYKLGRSWEKQFKLCHDCGFEPMPEGAGDRGNGAKLGYRQR